MHGHPQRQLTALAGLLWKAATPATMPVSASNLTPWPGWQAAPGNRHADIIESNAGGES
jgi:hypothetical protein